MNIRVMNNRKLIIMWCYHNGVPVVECIEDISDFEDFLQDQMAEKLKGKKTGAYPKGRIEPMRFRARYNTDRYYEIWAIGLPEDITDEYIHNNIAILSDLIKERGIEIYTSS
jgi:hypothetical protein